MWPDMNEVLELLAELEKRIKAKDHFVISLDLRIDSSGSWDVVQYTNFAGVSDTEWLCKGESPLSMLAIIGQEINR